MRAVYEELLRLEADGEAAVLAIVTGASGSTPQVMGAKMVIRGDGTMVGTVGGGRFELEVLQAAAEVALEGRPRTVTFKLTTELGMCCGGQMEAYLEPVRARDRLVIFGAGHVAQPTAALALSIGFRVTVVDDREDWASAQRFPGCEVVNEEHEDFLDRAAWRATDHIFVTTHDHGIDRAIVEQVIGGPAAWIGMIGSRRKARKTTDHLVRRGIGPEAIERLRSPVGLNLGARTPEEIAVSIVGELIQVRYRGEEKRPRPRVLEVLSDAESG